MATNNKERIQKSRKLIITGDSMCGKRTLLCAFETKQFDDNCDLQIFDTPLVPVQVDGKTIPMALFNTGGYEPFARLRALLYPGTDIVLICFSVDNPCSAQSVINIWGPEIRRYCHRCPIILVACKKDLRTDPQTIAELNKQGKKPVTSHMGRQIATQIKANAYIECSSKTGEGVQDLLIRAARLSFRQRTHRTTNCQCILQ